MARVVRRLVYAYGGERGSAILAALVLMVVMTLLGFVLFDVARLEGRLKIDSLSGVQALEIAEAGLERGLHLLYLQYLCGPSETDDITPANCAVRPTDPNYITTNPPGPKIPYTTAPDCPAELLPANLTAAENADWKVLKQNVSFPLDPTLGSGSYTVCVRPSPSFPTDPTVAQFRSRSTFTTVTGTYHRMLELEGFVSAGAGSQPAAFGLGGTAGAMVGNALIAGSVQFMSCAESGTPPCVSFGSNTGVQNHYGGLDRTLRALIPTTNSLGSPVTSLNATFKVRQGRVRITSNSASIGSAGVVNQDTMAGVYTSGAWGPATGSPTNFEQCPPLNIGGGTQNNRCNVWTAAQGPYPPGDLTELPLLSAPTIINGTGYRCYFNPPGSTCPHTSDPVPGGNNVPEYFYTNSWHIDGDRATSGVAQGGSSTTITLATNASATSGAYTGMVIELVGGRGSGQNRLITGYNTGRVATVTPAWDSGADPDITTRYRLGCDVDGIGAPDRTGTEGVCRTVLTAFQDGTAPVAAVTGTAQAGTATSVTMAANSSPKDQAYTGMVMRLTGGAGSGSVSRIIDYDGSTKIATVMALPGEWTLITGTPTYTLSSAVGTVPVAIASGLAPRGGPATACRLQGDADLVSTVSIVRQRSDVGTAQAGTANTITLATDASSTNDAYTGMFVEIVGHRTVGVPDTVGVGQIRRITAYDGASRVATVNADWSTIPDSSSVYRIDAAAGIARGTAAGSVTLDGLASATNGMYTGMLIQLTGGPGAGQISEITGYNGSTRVATIGANWTTAPTASATFTATAGTANTITWTGTACPAAGHVMETTGGTGVGQQAIVSSCTSVGSVRTATVKEPWATIPDATTTFLYGTPYRIRAASCLLQVGGQAISPRINSETNLLNPMVFRRARADGNPVNVYVLRQVSAGASTTTPTVRIASFTSPAAPVTYTGRMALLADNTAYPTTPGFRIQAGLLAASTTEQPWCGTGYPCTYAFPGNHFFGGLTTGDVNIVASSAGRLFLGAFYAANVGETGKVTCCGGGTGQSFIAGTIHAQTYDFSDTSQPPKLYQAPWDLSLLPKTIGPGASGGVVVGSRLWRQIE